MISHNKVLQVFEIFVTDKANPTIELNYISTYTLLVAVLLSAQATDKLVNKITEPLFIVAKTPQEMLVLGEDALKVYIKSINYYNNKAKNIINTSKILLEKYNSEVPSLFDELLTLPGIGRKSANVILNTAYAHETIGVDTHVFRVSNRLGLCQTKNPYETEIALLEQVPLIFRKNAHHWLVLHGRYICKARKPLCDECKLASLCYYNASKN